MVPVVMAQTHSNVQRALLQPSQAAVTHTPSTTVEDKEVTMLMEMEMEMWLVLGVRVVSGGRHGAVNRRAMQSGEHQSGCERGARLTRMTRLMGTPEAADAGRGVGVPVKMVMLAKEALVRRRVAGAREQPGAAAAEAVNAAALDEAASEVAVEMTARRLLDKRGRTAAAPPLANSSGDLADCTANASDQSTDLSRC